MKGLKAILWTVAVFFLLHFLAAIIPWKFISSFFAVYGLDVSGFQGLMKYGLRTVLSVFGLIGIFFLILARNPLQHIHFISLAGFGSLYLGLFCLVVGAYYGFTWWYWLGDVLMFWIFGMLLIFFKTKVVEK